MTTRYQGWRDDPWAEPAAPPPKRPRRTPRWKGPPPSSLVWASRLLAAQAALSLFGGCAILVVAASGNDYTPGPADVALIVVLLLYVAVWLWLSVKTRAGLAWARIVATCLLGLGIVVEAATVAFAAGGSAGSALSAAASLVLFLVELVLLWRPSASAYVARRGVGARPEPADDATWANEVLRRQPRH